MKPYPRSVLKNLTRPLDMPINPGSNLTCRRMSGASSGRTIAGSSAACRDNELFWTEQFIVPTGLNSIRRPDNSAARSKGKVGQMVWRMTFAHKNILVYLRSCIYLNTQQTESRRSV
jgi:hypothetical protein